MELSLRERKKIKARQAIIDAATRLFIKKGYDGTTADEIAAEAEVSRSTFFRYFKAKEMVVFPYQDERIQMLRDLIGQYETEQTPFDSVRLGLLDMAAYFMSIKKELADQRKIIHESLHLLARQLEYDAVWEVVISERLAASRGKSSREDYEARLAAGIIFGAIEAVLYEWFSKGCKQDLVQLGRDGIELVRVGLASTDFTQLNDRSFE